MHWRGDLIRHTLGLIACLSIGVPAEALDPQRLLSDYSLTNWSEADGPFPFGVYAITQDQDGYLWLGTRAGLVRFDGSTFTAWKGVGALPNDRVSGLMTASDGSLWLRFGTIGGVARIRSGQLTVFDDRSGVDGIVNAILEARDGTIWVGGTHGLTRFKDDQWSSFGPSTGLPVAQVLTVFEDRGGTLWIGTSTGVYVRQHNQTTFSAHSSFWVADFAEDSSGVIWGCDASAGIRILRSAAGTVALSSTLARTACREVMRDGKGSLWVATRSDGLIRIREGRLDALERRTRSDGLDSDEMRTLFEDRDGTIWVGTRTGFSRLTESSVRLAVGGRESDPYVYAVSGTQRGGVWVATDEGLRHRTPGRVAANESDLLAGTIVKALHEGRDGTLWIATMDGVFRLNNGRLESLPLPRDKISSVVGMVTTDGGDVLWIGDWRQGVFRWKKGSLTAVTEGVERAQPYVLFADSRDRVWVGYWMGGLIAIDDEGVTHYSSAEGLPSGVVNAIFEDKAGTIWVGTSNGLGRFKDNRFRTFEGNGFPQATVVSIVDERQGALWFGTGVGLIRVDLGEFDRVQEEPTSRLRYKHLSTEDGLTGTLGRPSTPAASRDAEGHLWFVTSLGVVIVDPDRLYEHPTPSLLTIDGIVSDGRRFEPTSHLRLAPRTGRVEISYSVLSLIGAQKSQFRYKLEGFDNDWQHAGAARVVSYTNLPPLNYTFRVIAADATEGVGSMGAVLAFSIEPAFYQTTIFYVLLSCALVLTLSLVWRARVLQLRRGFKLVLAERTRLGREIHDTLLQSLVAVALEFDDISAQLDSTQQSLRTQISHARQQVEHYIRETRQSIWNLRSPTLQNADLPSALREFVEAAIVGAGTRFEVVVEGKPRRARRDVEEHLLRIGEEALNNAVHHAEASVIRLEVSYTSDSVSLRIQDDGRGFDASQISRAAGSHWGVVSMRERAEQIGARFGLTSEPGAGTMVEVVSPLRETS